jgi:hypothetical protein
VTKGGELASQKTGRIRHGDSMTTAGKIVVRTLVIVVLVGAVAAVLISVHRRQRVLLRGAVIRQDSDPQKQTPIADVEISTTAASTVIDAKSNAEGFFQLALPKGFRRRQPITLQFRHPDYHPLVLNEFLGDQLYVVHMEPFAPPVVAEADGPTIAVSNVRVRYSVKATTEADVGSAVKTFQVVNAGNVPCRGQSPCSPDGKWKAALGSASLDAGEGNQFRNARVSCIAGPCPFTKIESEGLTHEGQSMTVAALNWSDTATFLIEAEVVHPMASDIVRDSYPVIFGQTLNFSLPAAAEGPSIEAEVNGEAIVFPLGPDLFLSWAQCAVEMSKEQSRLYRCEIKRGYQLR